MRFTDEHAALVNRYLLTSTGEESYRIGLMSALCIVTGVRLTHQLVGRAAEMTNAQMAGEVRRSPEIRKAMQQAAIANARRRKRAAEVL